ncbi:hypothetical protein DFH08DRAFT_976441 [Mycena albidolilacea]|uniref:Uncharacterized protein n=1 Tax=Mycena albidolilacea TaxID=1033008 RepID=A0AAD7E9M0_9AGAR|nr:hypothetical protein DFH08DRAFT_976441 [Mycena albidolilacea]
MPTLTHLGVNSFFDDTTDYDAVRSQTILQCIVVLVQQPIMDVHDVHPWTDDDCFVLIHQEKSCSLDWLAGARAGDDYWVFADAFIAARRAGKVDVLQYIISNIHES